MARYSAGDVLTCTHKECNCRVVIVDECHCEGVSDESMYFCACGGPLIPVNADNTSESS